MVAKPHWAYRYLFHGTPLSSGFHIVADAKGIINEEKNPRDDIFDQSLGAETDGQANNTCAGYHGPDVHTQFRQHNHGYYYHQDSKDELSQEYEQGSLPGAAGAAFFHLFFIIGEFLPEFSVN